MRYKNNILDKLVRLETTLSKLTIQINRNEIQESTLESVSDLKEQVEEIRSMISNEPDDLEQQFNG